MPPPPYPRPAVVSAHERSTLQSKVTLKEPILDLLRDWVLNFNSLLVVRRQSLMRVS